MSYPNGVPAHVNPIASIGPGLVVYPEYRTSTVPTGPRTPAIPARVEELSQALDAAHNELGLLESQLVPVLSPGPRGEDNAPPCPASPESELSNRIASVANGIRALSYRIVGLRGRLEV